MADAPSFRTNEHPTDTAAPEVLRPKADEAALSNSSSVSPSDPKLKRPRHVTYRPSHKATFIGLAVVVIILALNAGIIAFVIKTQSRNKSSLSQAQVVISQSALDKLGVSRNAVGDAGIKLLVNPNAQFNGSVQIGGNVSIAGQLALNSKFSASDASLAQLEAGNTTLSQLNVNGSSTLSTLNLRSNLVVAGTTTLQGSVTLSQLFTVNNSVNIAGNLAVGGLLSINSLHTSVITVDSSLVIGGHVITRGSAPSVGPGAALGTNGTVSISGNDAAGTVAVNIGSGASSGIMANIIFHTSYGTVPHVVVSAIGSGVGSVYVNRSATGFSIGVNGALAPGGYAFDYMVAQ